MLRGETSNFQITELYEMLIKKKEFTEFKKGNFFNNFKEQYDNANLIILSSQYSNNDLDILGNLIEILKNDNKKIIIFDNALNQTMRAGFNRLDYYVYRNKKLPNKDILKMIEKDMFLDLGNMKKVNKKIELIAKKNDVFLIKREKIFCNFNQKSCPSLTEEGYKIYWDYGHITDKGAEFFAKIIENDELFLKYLNSILRQTSH